MTLFHHYNFFKDQVLAHYMSKNIILIKAEHLQYIEAGILKRWSWWWDGLLSKIAGLSL